MEIDVEIGRMELWLNMYETDLEQKRANSFISSMYTWVLQDN